MSKIRIWGNPSIWNERIPVGKEPIRDSSPVLVREPHKRRMTKPFEFVEPKGDVDDVEVNSLKAFEAKPVLNLSEAKRYVSIANHQHLRKSKRPLIEAELDYYKSLRAFNLCGNCKKPIRVKYSVVGTGTDKDNIQNVPNIRKARPSKIRKGPERRGYHYTYKQEPNAMYADIEAHYRVFQHPTNPNKARFELIPKKRVFNQKCGCGI